MSIGYIRQFIKEKAEQFGAKQDLEFNKSYIERNNTGGEALKDNGAYFGFISSEEENSGPYHDFSLTIFPAENQPWLLCLGIGSSGFKNDYELATYPGVRRLFSKLVNHSGFCKSDLSDIETNLPKSFVSDNRLLHIKNTIRNYTKVLPVCQIIEEPQSQEALLLISAFVAGYAKLRDWPTNKEQRKAVSEALAPFLKNDNANYSAEVHGLLKERKYVVLQGPPGTGKTRLAKQIALEFNAVTFFTQFHAETSFSDFVYGIRPSTNDNNLIYSEVLGCFTQAVKFSENNTGHKVVLMIDEINRANLSNVLGPVFYLFEHKMDDANVEIELTPNYAIKKLPDNLYVIATMNTADRSLAVVDFALRRRFAWFTIKPHPISNHNFFSEDFFRIQEIFDWYASSSELSLQPGQGYFIANNENEMSNRLKYELYPLIREYLQEGLLVSAKEEFNNYFTNRINLSLFE